MFFENLNKILKKRNMTGAELARKLNLSSGIYTHWKNGKIPNGDTLIEIAKELDISVDWLLDLTDQTQDEQELLSFYRKADEKGKKTIYAIAEIQAQEQQSLTSGNGYKEKSEA